MITFHRFTNTESDLNNDRSYKNIVIVVDSESLFIFIVAVTRSFEKIRRPTISLYSTLC